MSEGIPKSHFQIETEKKWANTEDEARRDNATFDEAQRTIAEIKGAEGNNLSFEDAEKLFGKDFFGAKDVEQVFGRTEALPPIPFSKEELERAKELGQQLIYQTDVMDVMDPDTGTRERNIPITLENFKRKFKKAHDGQSMVYSPSGYENYENEDFSKEKPRVGWRLTSRDTIPNSTSKNYLEQTSVLVEYLQNEVFKGAELPKQYQNAIAEFRRKKAKIARPMNDDRYAAPSQALVDLKITKLARELPVETLYRLILNNHSHKNKPLPSAYIWTAGRASNGDIVYVGSEDMGVHKESSRIRYADLGVSFSRGS